MENRVLPSRSRIQLKITVIAVLALLFLMTLEGTVWSAISPRKSPEKLLGDVQGRRLRDRFGVVAVQLWNQDPVELERKLDHMAAGGIGWCRVDFCWADMEPLKGEWNLDGWDRMLDAAQERGIKILGILGGSPPWANGGKEWNYPPSDMEAWRDYVYTVSERYKGRVAAWEIWNEENINGFFMPAADSQLYVALLSIASPAIRSADPDATIVMGGVAGVGSDYIRACLQQGAAHYVDAIAYHPYPETISFLNFTPQESSCRRIVHDLRGLISRYTQKDIKLWITEVGWTTCSYRPPGVSLDAQADYLSRTLLNYAGEEVERIFYFNFADGKVDYPFNLVKYGLLNGDLSEKPSYKFYQTIERTLGDAHPSSSDGVKVTCSRPSSLEIHAFRFPDGGVALALWKSDDLEDTFSLRIEIPRLADPLMVDLASGISSPLAGVSRDENGNILVDGLIGGKRPLLLRLLPLQSDPLPFKKYLAEGYTGANFHQYLCLGNPYLELAQVKVSYLFPQSEVLEEEFQVPANSRVTVNVNAELGPGREVSAIVSSDRDIVVERPMYFNYGGSYTGGHVVMAISNPAQTWYFAEGYTGPGFHQYVCVLNPGNTNAALTFRFQTQEIGEVIMDGWEVAPLSRKTFNVVEILGRGYQSSLSLESTVPVVVERAMYFDYLANGMAHWSGGHCVMGSTSLAQEYYFAEGTTQSGFEEWLTVQNVQPFTLVVEATYQFGEDQGTPLNKVYSVEKGKRLTISVPQEADRDRDVSVRLRSNAGFVAERVIYFRYRFQGVDWTGGQCAIGASDASAQWFFAEGSTYHGFHEWLSLHNHGDEESTVELSYITQEEGALPVRVIKVPAKSRKTVWVNGDAGENYQLACKIRVLSGPNIVVERPMYFNYAGWDGGNVAFGYVLGD